MLTGYSVDTFYSWHYAFEQIGENPPSDEDLKNFIGPAIDVSLERYSSLTKEQIQKIIPIYRNHYYEEGYRKSLLYPRMRALLRTLHGQGARVLVATGKPERAGRRILEYFRLMSFIDGISGVGPVDAGVDKPALIRRVLGDTDPSNAVMIGDYPSDMSAAKELGIKFKLGAEVYFSTRLNEMELDELCFTDTNYILIEFPTDEKPYGLTHTVVDIINRGYQPILAHVERYPYFTSDPTRLYDLVEKGCIVQINAGAIIQGNKIAMKYIKWGMAQLICTDCHDLEKRSPNLREAYSIVKKKFGEDYVDWFDRNARNVFLGKYVDMPQPKMPKKVMGIWI